MEEFGHLSYGRGTAVPGYGVEEARGHLERGREGERPGKERSEGRRKVIRQRGSNVDPSFEYRYR